MKRSENVVGVRELRTRLSAYLRAVRQGKTITIGDRQRRPVARLVPIARSPDEELLAGLAEGGLLQRGVGKPSGKPTVSSRSTKRLLSEIVAQDRE